MINRFSWLALLLGSLPAFACAASPAAAPLKVGTISVEAAAGETGLSRWLPAFVRAVDQALAAHGFTIIDEPGHAAHVASVALSRSAVGTATTTVPVDGPVFAPGGAFGSVGAGVSFSLPSGKRKTVPLQQVRLDISIRKRGEDGVVWQGAALTIRAAEPSQRQVDALASDLAGAVLQQFPDRPGSLVSVP